VLIGLDFDNTIVGYDDVFRAAAIARAWLPAGFAGGKRLVRDTLRGEDGGERKWMELQGEVYGSRMGDAVMFDGVTAFLARCRRAGATVAVVSHKTERGHFDPAGTDLRAAARTWMAAQGLFAAGLAPADVYFEAERAAKIARIAALGCDVFVDDLEEVLLDPAFPRGCRRLHFAGTGGARDLPFPSHADWGGIADAVFGPA